jgi:hypothetical protein
MQKIPNYTFKKIVNRILPLVMALFQGTKKLLGPSAIGPRLCQ